MPRIAVFIASAMTLAAAASAAAGAAAAAEVLRVSLHLPMSHPLGRNLLEFKFEVEGAGGGPLHVEVYSGAALYNDAEIPAAVASGAIEMGVAPLARLAPRAPAVDLFYIPFLFPDDAAAAAASRPDSPIRRPLDEQILATGARVLWWQTGGSIAVLGRSAPILRPAEVQGRRIRVFDNVVGDVIAQLGGRPVATPDSEQYGAYARDLVEAGLTDIASVESLRLYEVARYLLVARPLTMEFAVLINEKLWQRLSDGERAVLTRAARAVEAKMRRETGRLEAETLANLRRRMEFVELTPAQREEWRQASGGMVSAYIQRAGDLGRRLVEAARAGR